MRLPMGFSANWRLPWWLLAAALAVLALALTLAQLLARPHVFHGSLIDTPQRAPEIALADQAGQRFRLSEQAGQVVLLYFGYTSCPDACPTTMAEFAQLRRRLGPQADRARFVFITVDPQRDTATQVAGYLAGFDPALLGLTGDLGELRPIWRSYGVYQAARADLATLEHSDRIYVIDAAGRLRLTYSLDTPLDALEADLRALIGEARRP